MSSWIYLKVYSRIVRSNYQMKKSVDGETVEFTDNLKACIFAASSLSLLRDGPHAEVLWGGKRGCAPRLGGARRSDGLLGAPRRRETAVYGRGCGGVCGVAKIACFAVRAGRVQY